ncbi:hypothetical protein [Pseudomonas sp. FW300-N2F2]|uniref:hypothetical protein n=1 Tax=Pseudomonas sp. FW300-N2F2 TaxID=2751320 RepID=UPI001A934748|nr:hypothetical protein [Pseudomonas sp. FW300-N2F2]
MTDQLCAVFIPALVLLLNDAETRKGSPLSEAEVLAIRDGATCIAVPFDVALQMERDRGLRDVIAEDCWSEWQRVRHVMNAPSL